ncbi:polysaccharide biosynthesis tyrosine autokinase [Desulfopila sp. IMCC35006]|uniref:polysaccharide biosynthesis tyrosine autokinase n=1 Tax=Desulfopila sp. IMCC35006 TaxID=2569542 RepID=UPI0010AD73AE|nr:polysaccharide biosynthesis tyrosine autokinase [Desulfopila sp. IMCC35006]TKB25008.1 polysaccharide biosynthesis tyrosine autokinase [Desulfopila sp. IMCC35006]
MAKISEVLKKAQYDQDFERQVAERKIQQLKQYPAEPIPVSSQEKVTPQHQRGNSQSGKWDERLYQAVNDDSYLPEVFKTLRSRILHPLDGRTMPKTIMITSALPKEGKSFVTANLGISLARGLDQHALLVDCDLRKPAMAKMFGLNNSRGLVDYLLDEAALPELIAKIAIKSLSVLPSGKPPANPAELLGSTRMAALVEELSSRYEDRIIIFDTPPLLVAAESSVLAGQVDAVILVVRQSCSGRAQIQKIVNIIGEERILGVVFNDQYINPLQESIIKGYGSYYGGYYE